MSCTRTSPLILLVEDTPMVMNATSALLRRLGFEVAQATTGEAAISVAELLALRLDTAIVDLGLPGRLDGALTIRALRDIRPGLTVLVASGDVPETVAARLRAADVEADAILTKPYTLHELRGVLKLSAATAC